MGIDELEQEFGRVLCKTKDELNLIAQDYNQTLGIIITDTNVDELTDFSIVLERVRQAVRHYWYPNGAIVPMFVILLYEVTIEEFEKKLYLHVSRVKTRQVQHGATVEQYAATEVWIEV